MARFEEFISERGEYCAAIHFIPADTIP